jgi:hypothetical protein
MYASFGYMNASYYTVEIVYYSNLSIFGETKSLVVPVGVKSG